MSVTEVPLQPLKRGALTRLWLAIIALVAAAFVLAFMTVRPLAGVTTPGGVVVRTLKAGSGPKMGPMDGAAIEYEGRLPDGKIFDSTAGRGPAPMLRMGVIPGFAEALGEMQQGGRYQVRIPAAKAYGASPPPGSPIPPNSDLIFDVEMVKLVPNAALMMQQEQQQQQQQQAGAGGEPMPGEGAPQPRR